MTFKGFSRLSVTTQSLSAQLFSSESVSTSQDSVGLYAGKVRSATHDNGTLYLTTHRLIYVDSARPEFNSCALDLSLVRQTEYWAGFLKSSAKVTLLLDDSVSDVASTSKNGFPNDSTRVEEQLHPAAASWVCRVCGMSNAPAPKCSLCGVPRTASANSQPPSRPASVQPPQPSSSQPSAVDPSDNRISCPACTFLNHPSMLTCELCDSPLDSQSSAGTTPPPASTSSSSPAPPPTADSGFVKLSFRRGGDKAFYAALKKNLHAKAWLTHPAEPQAERFNLAGIDGILRTMDTETADRDTSMQSALSDLEALMSQAKAMVDLAQALNAKLAASNSSSNSKEATAVKTSLQAMGLVDVAITPDMAASSLDYSKQLAKELATVLEQRKVLQREGMMGLDEVWCIWNRARGVSLVSPKDFKDALAHLPTQIHHRTFRSGLSVLHSPQYAQDAFTARLLAALAQEDRASGISSLEVAQQESLSVTLVTEMCESVEEQQQICRDEQGGSGLKWWPNLFAELAVPVWSS